MLSWVISLMLLPLIVLIHVVITLFDVLGAAWLTLCRSCSAVFASFREEKEMRGSDDLAVAQTQSQSCMLRCGSNPVEMFDPLTADWGRLRRLYVEAGIPFVLRHADGRPFMPVDELPDNVQRNLAAGADNSTLDSTSGFIRILFAKWCAPLPAVDAVRQKLLPWSWRANWPIWFLGNYTGGAAHVDLGPACINLYLLVQGRKDVVIVPPTETRKTHLVAGCDSMYTFPAAPSRARGWRKAMHAAVQATTTWFSRGSRCLCLTTPNASTSSSMRAMCSHAHSPPASSALSTRTAAQRCTWRPTRTCGGVSLRSLETKLPAAPGWRSVRKALLAVPENTRASPRAARPARGGGRRGPHPGDAERAWATWGSTPPRPPTYARGRWRGRGRRDGGRGPLGGLAEMQRAGRLDDERASGASRA